MNAATWLACADPGPMLRALEGRASDRKLQLFACACVRRVGHLAPSRRASDALAVAERHADGLATLDEARAAGRCNWEPASRAAGGPHKQHPSYSWRDAWATAWAPARAAARAGARPALRGPAWDAAWAAEEAAQVHLLRCIFGEPAPPRRVIDPAWLSWNAGTVGRMARVIYDEHRWQDCPVLADALEEAGATDQHLLDHLRSPDPHGRGCWAVDALLRKS
jgi:hypothetical protein